MELAPFHSKEQNPVTGTIIAEDSFSKSVGFFKIGIEAVQNSVCILLYLFNIFLG